MEQYKTNFAESVLEVVRLIPKGQTMTYGEVATEAGSPGAARAVGSIMSRNFDESVPCHRVIHANGTLGNYNRGGTNKKREILHAEGAIK